MKVYNEERRRHEQSRLSAEQPVISAAIVLARELVQLLRIIPHIATVGTGGAGVLGRMTDGEQLIPLALRLPMLGGAHDGECGNSGGA